MKNNRLSFIFRIVLLLISSIAISNCWAYSSKTTATSYKKLLKIVNNLPSPRNTLLVLDDDDTLTMMPCSNSDSPEACQYIGGPAWFDWQVSLSQDSPYRVAKSFNELIDVNALLFRLSNMPYVEEDIPMVLYRLTAKKGVKLVVETARGLENISATARQLKNLTAPKNSDLLSLINANALKGTAKTDSSLASPFQPCGNDAARPVAYQHGIFYVAGQNKGQMLRCLFQETNSTQIKNIVFLDDTQKNVDDIYQEFLNDSRYNVIAIYYTRLEKHKEAFTVGGKAKLYQQAANRRWKDLRRLMENNFVEPSLPIEES